MYIPFSSKVQALSAVVPEGHADTGDGVEDLEATNGLLGIARVPETELAIAHARETRGGDAVGLAHPHTAAVLCARVAGYLLGRLFLSHIPHAQLLVAARGDQHRSIGAPGHGLHNVIVLEGELWHTSFDIPDLHGVVAR